MNELKDMIAKIKFIYRADFKDIAHKIGRNQAYLYDTVNKGESPTIKKLLLKHYPDINKETPNGKDNGELKERLKTTEDMLRKVMDQNTMLLEILKNQSK